MNLEAPGCLFQSQTALVSQSLLSPPFPSFPSTFPFFYLMLIHPSIQTPNIACENPRGVDDDAYPGFCRLTETDIYLSPKDREPCEECGGEPEPPAWWDGSVWGGGKEEKGKWRLVFFFFFIYFFFFALNYLLEDFIIVF